MTPDRNDLLTGLLAGVLCIAYAVLAHYTSAAPEVGPWAVLLAGAPLAIVGLTFARESRGGGIVWLLIGAVVGTLAWAWPRLHNPVGWLYFIQHVSINAVLGMIFGRSLLPGHEPLVTALARLVHKEMTPELLRYTRQVTVAWTVFFLASAALSVLLFVFAPIKAWSVFANILALPLVAAMFIVENEVRKRILPPATRSASSRPCAPSGPRCGHERGPWHRPDGALFAGRHHRPPARRRGHRCAVPRRCRSACRAAAGR